jgi:hypothetical protein
MPARKRRRASGANLWMYSGIALSVFRLARRLLRDDEEVLYRTVIKGGDTFQILSRKPTRK